MSEYIKVTIPELGACAVSIYTCPPNVTAANLGKFVAKSQRAANGKGIKATYEASTRAEYVAFRESQRAHIADKAQAVAAIVSSN